MTEGEAAINNLLKNICGRREGGEAPRPPSNPPDQPNLPWQWLKADSQGGEASLKAPQDGGWGIALISLSRGRRLSSLSGHLFKLPPSFSTLLLFHLSKGGPNPPPVTSPLTIMKSSPPLGETSPANNLGSQQARQAATARKPKLI